MMNNIAALSFKAKLFKMTGCCIFFIMLAAPQLLRAQVRGKVTIVQDPRIDTLLARRMETPKGNANYTGGSSYASSSGYRVQIFSGSSRAAAYAAMAKMQELHPELRTYISYREPNFKVHAGDFRTRLEASHLVEEIRRNFPILFIIAEKINPPKLETQ